MQRACIAIVDAAHARIFTFDTDGAPPHQLQEVRDLVSAGRQAHGMFTDHYGHHRHAHSTRQDNRAEHLNELDYRFGRVIIDEIDRVLADYDLERVILVASPKMLGTLRDIDGAMRRPPVVVDEIPQNLSWMTTAQLHDHLAAMSLIQPRERVMPDRAAHRMR